MQFKSIFVILAAGLSMVMAGEDVDTTVTSTSTQTKTLTITECNPTNTACPMYHSKNSTVSARPTWSGGKNSTEWAAPTGSMTTETTPQGTAPTKTGAPSPIATGAAGGLFVQSGLMLGVLGAGIALVA